MRSPKLEGSTEVATTRRFRDGFPGNIGPKRRGGVGLTPKGRRCCRQRDCHGQGQMRQNSISPVESSAFRGHNEWGRKGWEMALRLLGTGHKTLHMMLKDVDDGQGLTRGSGYLICNSVPVLVFAPVGRWNLPEFSSLWPTFTEPTVSGPAHPGHCAGEIRNMWSLPSRSWHSGVLSFRNGSPERMHHTFRYSHTVPLPQCFDWQPQPSQLMFSSLTFCKSRGLIYLPCLLTEQYLVNYTDAETQKQAQEQDALHELWWHRYHRWLLAPFNTNCRAKPRVLWLEHPFAAQQIKLSSQNTGFLPNFRTMLERARHSHECLRTNEMKMQTPLNSHRTPCIWWEIWTQEWLSMSRGSHQLNSVRPSGLRRVEVSASLSKDISNQNLHSWPYLDKKGSL